LPGELRLDPVTHGARRPVGESHGTGPRVLSRVAPPIDWARRERMADRVPGEQASSQRGYPLQASSETSIRKEGTRNALGPFAHNRDGRSVLPTGGPRGAPPIQSRLLRGHARSSASPCRDETALCLALDRPRDCTASSNRQARSTFIATRRRAITSSSSSTRSSMSATSATRSVGSGSARRTIRNGTGAITTYFCSTAGAPR
jgi:hypothetical protein